MRLPGVVTTALSDTSPIKSELAFEGAPDALLDETNEDPGNDPKWRFRAGAVVVACAARKTFVEADDPAGDRNEPATVLALQPADANWAGKVLELSVDGGPAFTVALGPQDATNAAVLAALQKDQRVPSMVVVDEAQGVLRLRTLGAGAGKTLRVLLQGHALAFGPTGTEAIGKDADYRVTLADADLIDSAGAPARATTACCRKGHFATAKLRHVTADAKAALLRRGAFFD